MKWTGVSPWVEALTAEVKEAKETFAKRLKEMEVALRSAEGRVKLAAAGAAAEEQHAAAIAEMKQAHLAATDGVVKKHNKKYNEMLTERMAAEEALSTKNSALSDEIEKLRKQLEGGESETNKAVEKLKKKVAEAGAFTLVHFSAQRKHLLWDRGGV